MRRWLAGLVILATGCHRCQSVQDFELGLAIVFLVLVGIGILIHGARSD